MNINPERMKNVLFYVHTSHLEKQKEILYKCLIVRCLKKQNSLKNTLCRQYIKSIALELVDKYKRPFIKLFLTTGKNLYKAPL